MISKQHEATEGIAKVRAGLHLKYSRFSETRARDRARSALRGVGGSLAQRFSKAIWHFGTFKMCAGLCPERAEIGWFRFAHRVQSRYWRDMHDEKTKQNSRRTRSLYQGGNGIHLRLSERYDDLRSA